MTKYFSVKIENLEPLRIGDASTSQRGQTDTLLYIPGTVIRGIVLHGIQEEKDFETYKRLLLSDQVRFLNIYPAVKKDKKWIPLLPSIRGFREQKGGKEIASEMFGGKLSEGMKNAQIGAFCLPEEQILWYLKQKLGSDLNLDVRKAEDNLFRSQYLCRNQIFQGYIAVEEEEKHEAEKSVEELLKEVLKGKIRIGNRRTSGYGTCSIELEETAALPYQDYAASRALEGSCYLLLLSDTLMRGSNGEMAGLDLDNLGKQMGVENLKIEQAAAGVREMGGFNSTWRCRVPSVKMYEKGSIFSLSYSGCLEEDKMARLEDQGIGIRKNEGCGRILFLDRETALAKLTHKRKWEDDVNERTQQEQHQNEEIPDKWEKLEKQNLTIIARGYYEGLLDRVCLKYVLNHALPAKGMSKSQIGTVYAIASQYRNAPQTAKEKLEQYFKNLQKRQKDAKRQSERGNAAEFSRFIKKLGEKGLPAILCEEMEEKERLPEKVMGKSVADLFSEEELERRKLLLLIDMIRYANKEGKGNV